MLHYKSAIPSNSKALTQIAHASKQHWKYPDHWMQLWQKELEISPDYILQNKVVEVYNDSERIGFYSIIEGNEPEIDHLWLMPDNVRQGFGSQVFSHIRQTVSESGKWVFRLVAEPCAKGFYDRMNGVVIGSFESKIPGRFLEIYEFAVRPDLSISDAAESDFFELACVWESSVRATHDFLRPGDFQFFRQMVFSGEVFRSVEILKKVRCDNRIAAFIGVSGDNLEMLFVHAEYRSKGIGRFLVGFALEHLGVRKVEVNKDNTQAVVFYMRSGFRTYDETPTDGLGKPYPLLIMSIVDQFPDNFLTQ